VSSSTPDAPPPVGRPPDAYEFGRNWQRYIEHHLDEERVAIAQASLLELVGDVSGKVFLDVGAGSGLFSLCALRAGAARVVSLDVDPDSVAACHRLRQTAGDAANWEILEGSILDPALVESLPRGDVVYSWGVLHHTGDMYTAIRNVSRLVGPQGSLCIAIYNRVTGRFIDSDRWLRIKRAYNRAPAPGRRLLEAAYIGYWGARHVLSGTNPFRLAAERKRSRGMAFTTDVADWLGGLPYEYATADEIVSFCQTECGLEAVHVNRVPPASIGNNEFVFRPGEPT